MIHLSKLLSSSFTKRTLGDVANLSHCLHNVGTKKDTFRSEEKVTLPWCTRPTYNIYASEWELLNRMLAGIIEMTNLEISERSLRLIGHDLLFEIEDPSVRLHEQRLQQPNLAPREQKKMLASRKNESTTINRRNNRQGQKGPFPSPSRVHHISKLPRYADNMNMKGLPSACLPILSASSHLGQTGGKNKIKNHTSSEASKTVVSQKCRAMRTVAKNNLTENLSVIPSCTSKRSLESGKQIRPFANGANDVHQRCTKSCPGSARSHMGTAKSETTVEPLGLGALPCSTGSSHATLSSDIPRDTAAVLLSLPRKHLPTKKIPFGSNTSSVEARKRMIPRKSKDKVVISVHLV